MGDDYDSYDYGGSYADPAPAAFNPAVDSQSANADLPYGGYSDAATTFNPAQDSQAANASLGLGPNSDYSGGVSLGSLGSGAGSSSFDLMALAKQLGLTKGGNYDLSKLLGLGAAGAQLASAFRQPAYQAKTTTQLLSGMTGNFPSYSADQLSAMRVPMKSGTNMQRATPSAAPLSMVAGTRGYAEGGEVQGPLSMVPPPGPSGPSMGGGPQQPFAGPVPQDTGGGQEDLFDAKLAGGEYVFDAESVSMLGDGNTAAGVQKLDQLRQELRAQKRSAPNGQIPDQAQGPLSYTQGNTANG